MSERVRAHAPGRVNLIGEHVDYAGGLALPIAVDLGTTVLAQRGHERVVLSSRSFDGVAEVALDVDDPAATEPEWARLVAGVVAELRPETGFVGEVATTIPVGAGLSSSAALEVASRCSASTAPRARTSSGSPSPSSASEPSTGRQACRAA